jgi:hypothetical protein
VPSMDGTVTIVQESRFQLTDTGGVSHLFLLAHGAAVEPEQLPPLQHEQARVRVRYRASGENLIGFVADRLDRLDR